ncbi:MAG: thioredoxin [Anaerolineae bacterium]|nr:thioredoxin [Anaerolineae bacterium]
MSQHTFEVTDENFAAQVLQSDLPVLVDFTADWCPPCKMIAPYVDDIAQKYQDKLVVGTLDSDAYPQFTDQYGVMGLPTLILFHKGEPVQRIVGFMPREKIEARIVPHLQLEQA